MTLERVPCPICGVDETRPLLRKLGLELATCRRCGLVSANPRLSREEIWQRYSAEYFRGEYLPAMGVRDGRFDLDGFDRRYAPMLAWLEARAGGRGRLLEVGVGAGFFSKAAERAGWTVTGLEVSSEALAFARDRLGLDVRQSPAESMTLADASIDVAVMFDVAEHLLSPVPAFEAIRRVLRPGGLLALSTPNIEALSRLALGVDWAVLSPAEHVYYYSEATLGRLLRRVGFVNVSFDRRFQGYSVLQIMNPDYTHSPDGFRARTYRALVRTVGPWCYRVVQRAGKGDVLLCSARAPD
jgi:SAM-dependent methyltransferase